jgi:serine/threonine-protein kinase
MGQAFEKIEDFGKAAGVYRDIAKFNPEYPGIQKKIEKIERLKKDIIKIYHKDRYDKKEEVGRGGIGVVYKAKDIRLERMVALKILNQNPIPEKRDIESFISEAKKVAKLHHANIVGVYDYGQIENDYFISMEFIEGINLETLISNKHPIPIPDIMVIAKKLFAALAHSHKNGVIHSDIKPKNIMITYENEVKVVDFGIAVLRDDLRREDKDVILGTPFYMSPEQFGNKKTDHLSDIYSTGVTLFQLVTGIIPFPGSSHSEIMQKHLSQPVPSIKKYRNDVPEKLVQIIEKCMEKSKKDRYQRAPQVLKEIDGIRDNKGKSIITDKTRLKIFDTARITPLTIEEKIQTQAISKKAGSSNTTNPYES